MFTHTRRRTRFGLPLVVLLLAAPGARSAPPPHYRIVEIAASANEMVDGVSLNDSNEALVAIGNGPFGQRLLLYTHGALQDLKLKGYPEQTVLTVTNNHRLLGTAQSKTEPSRIFYLDAQRRMHWRSAPGDCDQPQMNGKGEMIARMHGRDQEQDSVAYWDAAGAFRKIHLPYKQVEVLGWINGSEFLAQGTKGELFQSYPLIVSAKTGRVQRKITRTASRLTSIKAVRADGAFAGMIFSKDGAEPFKFVHGRVVKLPYRGFTDGEALAMDGHDNVVGTTYDQRIGQPLSVPDTVNKSPNKASEASDVFTDVEMLSGVMWGQTATLWVGKQRYDLNRLCKNANGWQLHSATAINARGVILCNGMHHRHRVACLLIPENQAAK